MPADGPAVWFSTSLTVCGFLDHPGDSNVE
jgi:hypothetical protein